MPEVPEEPEVPSTPEVPEEPEVPEPTLTSNTYSPFAFSAPTTAPLKTSFVLFVDTVP